MSHIPVALRRAVHERANEACGYCLFPSALAFVAHEVDHVIALSNESPDDVAAWLEAMAARSPDKHGRDKNADWGLVYLGPDDR